jgi:hypothetical protein
VYRHGKRAELFFLGLSDGKQHTTNEEEEEESEKEKSGSKVFS